MTMTTTTKAPAATMPDVARRPLSGGSGDALMGSVAREDSGVVA